ncbi:MAG: gamma-glutamylcyclotransferase [Paracoccus sp. (in: a-proteobacteria)]|nr:gamma-glutamylcyclotransferase [Paracoccus sp. (in: a-proteobacteria)]
MNKNDGNWVFAYGSLLWDPGFDMVERQVARLEGYARSFCLRSVTYRGTPEAPGLVLGLDADEAAHCTGLAMRVEDGPWPEVLAYLRERELTTSAYREEILPVALEDGRHVRAVTYVMRRDHHQYAGGLHLSEQARIIATAQGGRGPNADYLFNTAAHLNGIGLGCPQMDDLAGQVRAILAQGQDAGQGAQ